MPDNPSSSVDAITKKAAAIVAALKDLARRGESLPASQDVESIEAAPAIEAAVAAIPVAVRDALASLERALSVLRPKLSADADSYAGRVHAILRDRGLQPLGDPTRSVIGGIVHLDIDPALPEVRLNDRPLASLSPASVADQVDELMKSIERLMAPPPEFLVELERAYDDELKAAGLPLGTQVKVSAVHFRIMLGRQTRPFRQDPRKTSFRDYPMEVFRADLHSALQQGAPPLGRRRLEVASGSDTSGAIFMLLPALGRPGWAGRMSFVEHIA